MPAQLSDVELPGHPLTATCAHWICWSLGLPCSSSPALSRISAVSSTGRPEHKQPDYLAELRFIHGLAE